MRWSGSPPQSTLSLASSEPLFESINLKGVSIAERMSVECPGKLVTIWTIFESCSIYKGMEDSLEGRAKFEFLITLSHSITLSM